MAHSMQMTLPAFIKFINKYNNKTIVIMSQRNFVLNFTIILYPVVCDIHANFISNDSCNLMFRRKLQRALKN